MNSILLWLTARVVNYELKKNRWLIGSFVASLYFLFDFIDGMWEIIFKLGFSWLIIQLVFWPARIKESLVILLTFYGISFFLGGGLLGIIFLFDSPGGLEMGEVSWIYLLLGVLLGGGVLWGLKIIEHNLKLKSNQNVVEVYLNGSSCDFLAVVDSGNLLKSISGLPVIVVEKETVINLLPPMISECINATNGDGLSSLYLIYEKITGEEYRNLKLQPIYYNTVGNDKDVLLAFRPDNVIVHDLNYKSSREVKSLIAISKHRLNLPDSYKGLLPSELAV